MSLIIAGDRSNSGKTTITLALLSWLVHQGKKVQSFKVGPDYIDPMFHQYVTHRPCRNLDPILTSENYVKSCFSQHSQTVEYALIEGVMGLFDGLNLSHQIPQPNCSCHPHYLASTAHIARLLELPILLVIDCSSLSGTVAAILHGLTTFDPQVKIAGVIFNRVGSERHIELLKNAIQPLNIPLLGVLHRHHNITIPDRHLGLIPTDELPQLNQLIQHLIALAQTSFNWELLFPLLSTKSDPPKTDQHHLITLPQPIQETSKNPIKIAVAKDRAFNFYYQDNLDLLEQLGATLIYWSPLEDPSLPEAIEGFYFGGGFPEVFAQPLSENTPILQTIPTKINQFTPIIAECGGLMYLGQSIIDFQEKAWSMVGILPYSTIMAKHLTLGYRRGITLQNTPLFPPGKEIHGHEFHRSEIILNSSPLSPQENLTPSPNYQILNRLWRYDQYPEGEGKLEGFGSNFLHASYLHLHWGNQPEIPHRFLQLCRQHSPN